MDGDRRVCRFTPDHTVDQWEPLGQDAITIAHHARLRSASAVQMARTNRGEDSGVVVSE